MKLKSLSSTFRNTALAVFAAVALTVSPEPALAQMNPNAPERMEIVVDVAEDMNLFVEPRVPVGTEPVRGSFFVTEGKIFPAGTIPNSNGEQFDPNAVAGSIGTWFCNGTFLVSGSQFDKSPTAVLTDQIYLFPNDQKSIATAGTEGNGLAVRPVIGGTGIYAGYTGEQRQQFLGFNKTGGVNLRVTISLRKTANYK